PSPKPVRRSGGKKRPATSVPVSIRHHLPSDAGSPRNLGRSSVQPRSAPRRLWAGCGRSRRRRKGRPSGGKGAASARLRPACLPRHVSEEEGRLGPSRAGRPSSGLELNQIACCCEEIGAEILTMCRLFWGLPAALMEKNWTL
ncbi:hypothetical protein E2320_012682, partial [Naja naja]